MAFNLECLPMITYHNTLFAFSMSRSMIEVLAEFLGVPKS